MLYGEDFRIALLQAAVQGYAKAKRKIILMHVYVIECQASAMSKFDRNLNFI